MPAKRPVCARSVLTTVARRRAPAPLRAACGDGACARGRRASGTGRASPRLGSWPELSAEEAAGAADILIAQGILRSAEGARVRALDRPRSRLRGHRRPRAFPGARACRADPRRGRRLRRASRGSDRRCRAGRRPGAGRPPASGGRRRTLPGSARRGSRLAQSGACGATLRPAMGAVLLELGSAELRIAAPRGGRAPRSRRSS